MNEGLLEYSKPEWGPQPIKGIFFPEHPGLVFTVLEDSDIYEFEDLKGKRVPNLVTSPASNWMITAILAYGGLTRDDVENIDTTSTATAYEAVPDRRLDVSYFNVTSSNAYETDATYGIRYLEMPPDTEEGKKGWERVYKDFPGFSPKLATKGCKLSEDDPAWVLTMGNNIWFTWSDVDSSIPYFMAKALTETYDKYSENDPALKGDWSIETHWSTWENIGQIPLHEGAVQYYKEAGMWTEEREKINQERIKHQEELQEMWNTMIEEATEEGIELNAENLENMWNEVRKEKGMFTIEL
jgi:TRAP transporter TAXI family solute receptor